MAFGVCFLHLVYAGVRAEELGVKPLARIKGYADAARVRQVVVVMLRSMWCICVSYSVGEDGNAREGRAGGMIAPFDADAR